MNIYFHQFLWNNAMIFMIFLICIFCGLGVERDVKLRRNRPQVIKVKRGKVFLVLKNKKSRTRFVTLAVVLDYYGYIQMAVCGVINVLFFDFRPEKLELLGDFISTLQIGIVLCIFFIGYGIMILQRMCEKK